ncbi:peptidoglycan-binding domain-containing protein [Thiobaca trueperi]|uniref:Putative peptidoglycan binding protein n=1 Tax=Thiobaca trueperi TaxID=127458 RepID=A0A4R3N427_9GAMM|nr:peptidoglycan-binding domain-containing protein [Thiobaca trueperi]TCT21459.1 putative peptidoglycan binding protein [Thiobaca trueperi]
MRAFHRSAVFITVLLAGWHGVSSAQTLSAPTTGASEFRLLAEPMSAEWEASLLPPLLQSLMRIGPYVIQRASAIDALSAVGASTHHLALLRRSSALAAGAASPVEWLEIGPAACLTLVVRDDADWFSYGDLNYGSGRPLRVDVASVAAHQDFERLLTAFPLAGEVQIQVRPTLIALQRLAARDSDLAVLDVPRHGVGAHPSETMPLVAERGLRLLDIPPALIARAPGLTAGEVLISSGWFWESPRTYRTLCDPFVLAMPKGQADRLVYALHRVLSKGQVGAMTTAESAGMSVAIPDWTPVATAADPAPDPSPPAPVDVETPVPVPEPVQVEAETPVSTAICDPAKPYVLLHAGSETRLELVRCTLDQGEPRLLKEPPLSNPLVLMLQRHLNDLGFKAGRPDGLIGARTREAIRRFQTAEGQTSNGSITFDLIDRIQQAAASR